MYYGIAERHFRYCCSVWGGCSGTRLQAIQKLQNRAHKTARIVINSCYDVFKVFLKKAEEYLSLLGLSLLIFSICFALYIYMQVLDNSLLYKVLKFDMAPVKNPLD